MKMLVTIPYNFEREVLERLEQILANQAASARQEQINMATIDEAIAVITTKIEAQATIVASLGPFIQGLFDQIKNHVHDLTPAQLEALLVLQTKFEANNEAIAAAMVATPA